LAKLDADAFTRGPVHNATGSQNENEKFLIKEDYRAESERP
jgi:hypothetical protein